MSDYNKSKEAQEVFKNKTKPKTPIKFGISLNEEQKSQVLQVLLMVKLQK